MSTKTIKQAVAKRLIEEKLATKSQILTRYPRDRNNADAVNMTNVILWARYGREVRKAGSGRSAGPIQGVKQVPWNLIVHITRWGVEVEADYDEFEDLVDKMLAVFRSSTVLPYAEDQDGGSQVLSFAEEMSIENIEPQYAQQFVLFQTIITIKVEEIYNA